MVDGRERKGEKLVTANKIFVIYEQHANIGVKRNPSV